MGVEHHRKTPWEIAEGWYTVASVSQALREKRSVNTSPPPDTGSIEFAAWLTGQYRLAMAKGVQLGRDCSEDGMGVPGIMTDAMRHFDTDALIMSTAAYYLTTNVGDFCQRLRRAWPELSEDVRAYIQRLVESQFAREGVLRRLYLEPDWTLFGGDRDEWVAVRRLWAIKSEEQT